MPANLPPTYHQAEARYRAALTNEAPFYLRYKSSSVL